MTTREELRKDGTEMRHKLGFPAANADSELAPGLDNLSAELVFGSIWARPELALEDRMLATLSALTSRQYMPQLRRYIGAALHIGHPPCVIQEVIIHCGLYCGFPTILNSLALMKEVFEERGVAMPDTKIADLDAESLLEHGLETMQKFHGDRAQEGYAAPENTTTAAHYSTVIAYGYGEIWSRPDLDHRQRMICAVASFTAMNELTQLTKFAQSALNIGLSREQVIETIMQTGPYIGFSRALNALSVVGDALN